MVYKSGQIFLPFCHNSRVWRTDRIPIARPRLHCMQRGKNGITVSLLRTMTMIKKGHHLFEVNKGWRHQLPHQVTQTLVTLLLSRQHVRHPRTDYS